jgi:hypothetical protein
MTRSGVRSILPRVCGVIVAGVFLAAAIPKLLDPGSFAADIQNYRVLPEQFAGHAALFLPPFELMVGLALLWPRYQQGGALLATAMLLVFAGAMAQARVRGIDLSCGCFGAAFESKVSWWTVARSSGLALLSAVPTLWPPPRAATGVLPST